VGRQRMVHGVFFCDDFGYFRFAINGASDGKLGCLVIPVLDFRIIFGVPMDKNACAKE